jgi:hypothetical protein
MAQQTLTTDGGSCEDGASAEDPFEDVEYDPEDILGTHIYKNRLYSTAAAEENVPVNVLTGEKTREISPVEKAKAFAERTTREGGAQRVAVLQSTEGMIESQSGPYTSTVFYDRKVVCGQQTGTAEYGQPEHEYDGYNRMLAYRAAAASDRFEVRLEKADYETGAVTITVAEVESP